MRRLAVVSAFVLALLASTMAWADKSKEQAYVDAVIDGLVREGVLTFEKANEIKTDAQAAAEVVESGESPKKPGWFDTIKFGGYTQARWEWYPDADENEFLVRRSRIKLGAKPADRTEVELQLDLGDGDVTVKDAWVQYDLTEDGQWRARMGQQKIPFGFETPQSSSSRVPFERNWVARRTIDGERDTGLVLYWTDPEDAELFEAAKKTDFGTGDYGTVALGVYNGQGLSSEANEGKHFSLRFAKPFTLGERYAEAGASYYQGDYVSQAGTPTAMEFDEHLFGVHFYLPARPLGFQGEYFNGETEGADIDGFYAMGLWRPNDQGTAFVRYDELNGPRKGKGLGNRYDRERWSFGYAHMLNDKTEVTLEYDVQDTLSGDDDFFGLQVQVGY